MTENLDIRETAERLVEAVVRASASALSEASGKPLPDQWDAAGLCAPLAGRLTELGEQIFAQEDFDGTLSRHTETVLAMTLAGMLSEDEAAARGDDADAGLKVMAFAASQAVEATWPEGEDGARLEALIRSAA